MNSKGPLSRRIKHPYTHTGISTWCGWSLGMSSSYVHMCIRICIGIHGMYEWDLSIGSRVRDQKVQGLFTGPYFNTMLYVMEESLTYFQQS